jgi:hypothetical protein
MDNGSTDRCWRCSYCNHKRYLKISEAGGGATSHAVRHLKNPIEACECPKAWWKHQQQKDWGGSELCGSEVDSFNGRASSKVIGNGNASAARAKFVHIFQVLAAPFPNPEIYPVSYLKRKLHP